MHEPLGEGLDLDRLLGLSGAGALVIGGGGGVQRRKPSAARAMATCESASNVRMCEHRELDASASIVLLQRLRAI